MTRLTTHILSIDPGAKPAVRGVVEGDAPARIQPDGDGAARV
ncbi:MAG: hypothetical protein R3B49_11070 [Phycisphaerales bacterium]